MKKIIAYILIISIFLQTSQLHKEELLLFQNFISYSIEHIQAGDSFFDFLQKHYGKPDLVKKHLSKNHPDRKKPIEHDHNVENVHIWNFYFLPEININITINNLSDFDFYREPFSTAYLKPLYSPPELI